MAIEKELIREHNSTTEVRTRLLHITYYSTKTPPWGNVNKNINTNRSPNQSTIYIYIYIVKILFWFTEL